MPQKTILIVEDEPMLCELLAERLAEAGYRVLTSLGGNEAAETIKRERIDLLLTDLLMPGKDGIELIQDLQRSHPGMPVVAMSGGGQVDATYYLKMARMLGAKAILEKPFSNEQMLMTVALALPDDSPSGL